MSLTPARGFTLHEWVELNREDLEGELRSINPRWTPHAFGLDSQIEFDDYAESRYENMKLAGRLERETMQ